MPSSRYTSTASVPRLPPSTLTARNTPKVCSVKGTVAGMEIQEHTAISAANSAIYAMSTILNFFVPEPAIFVSSKSSFEFVQRQYSTGVDDCQLISLYEVYN